MTKVFSTLKNDLPASVVVFLVATPLCLGIALASGAPLLSGIISGMIGGIVVGFISQSQTSVAGPAAGLAAVVLASIAQLGGFEVFLTAVFIAGIFQLIMGIAQAGVIANYIPSNVIKGLLASIGILLIIKQIPHAFGYDKDPDGENAFFQIDGENSFSEIINALNHLTPGAVVISVTSILILFFWDKTPLKNVKLLPASLFVVILGVLANFIFTNYVPFLAIQASHLVSIPAIDTQNLSQYLHLPNLTDFANYRVWVVAITLAAVASLETLLNIEAVDKLDPHKRISPPNRELIAQGVGNICASLLGGLPVTSVIVRSSVNIQAGNDTKLSTILHGSFILIFVLFFSNILNLIPLASLAAILLITGYKLAKISLFKEMYSKGRPQFIPFVATILAIIFTDLLIGVLIGLATAIFYILRSNFKNPFLKEESQSHVGEVIRLELPNQVSFLNKASIKETLWSVPTNSKLVIDASYANFIDHDVIEIIEDFSTTTAPEKNIQLNILGLKSQYQLQQNIQFMSVLNKEAQQNLRPAIILDLLKVGNKRFLAGKGTDKNYLEQVKITSAGQYPMAVLIGCIDSRTSPEILFDAGLGDLLTVRIAGNIINPEIIGSLEIAVKKLGAKLIVVKGHSSCGAVALSLANVMEDNMHTVTAKIQKVAMQCGCYPKPENATDSEIMEKVTKENTYNSVKEILAQSAYLKAQIEAKEVGIVSAYHDISTGQVYFEELV